MALSEREILAAIDAQAERAYGSDGALDNERAQAMDYYLGRPYGNEVEGRSQVVTRDVLETVEWIMPSLMRIFTGGDKVVEFEPVGMEDEAGAKQETDVLNHVIMKQNDSFMNFMTWFKDAMLSKTSYVKIYWDESEDTTEETYENLSEAQIGMISQDPAVEIVEAWPGPMGFGVKIKKTEKSGKVCIDPVPPEEMRVAASVRGYSLKSSRYVEHRSMKTISEIREMGFKVEDDIASGSETIEGALEEAREQYFEDDEDEFGQESDPSMRQVLFRDVTIRIDANGDGIAELKRYYVVGSTVLADYDAENVYYACLGPIPLPHRHVGLSIADLVMDLQKIRSTLLRQYIDNLYLQNNGRFAISDRVNLDDMLTSRPGGVVRVEGEPAGAIMPLVHPSNGAAAIQGLEYIDTQKENRTGVTKYNQGLDSNSLNKTMGGITQIMGAAQQRIELLARVCAETGVKDAFLMTHELMQKHSTKPLSLKLNNSYVEVDPRQWKTRTDMTVSVGLGTGNKDQQQQHIATIMQVQEKGLAIGITDPKKIYNAAKRLSENAGFKDGDEFFTDPSTQPPKPPQPNPEVQKAQAEMQIKQQAAQMDAQMSQQKMAQDGQLAQQKMQADMAMAQQKMQNDIQLSREKMNAEIQLAREKAVAEAQIKAEVARMNGEVSMVNAMNQEAHEPGE